MRLLGAGLLSLMLLSACSKPETSQAAPGAPPKAPKTPLPEQLTGAAATPLNDLNLVRAKIPPVLIAAQKAPYAPPLVPGCEGLVQEIRGLDAALGPDLDLPSAPGGRGLLDRGRAEAGEAAVGAVKHAVEGLIPYRTWVRKLTGAERYSKQVVEAVAAGIVRRAYLKGLGQAQGCQAPAAPWRPAQPAEGSPAPEPPVSASPQ